MNISGGLSTCCQALLAGAVLAFSVSCASAQPLPSSGVAARPAPGYEWVTLGTQGGPLASQQRREPANLLIGQGQAHLVDVGDGAATQMIGAGVYYPQLRTIFISHIHFDHIGGLFAVLGLRFQTLVETPLTIYGPPGTKEIVDNLIKAMGPSAASGYGTPGEPARDASKNISVVELTHGSVVQLGAIPVTAAENTHYSFEPNSEAATRFKSLSFRFDLPGRSIVYTGDTGPSSAVETLAQGADLLVSEIVDLKSTRSMIIERAPTMSEEDLKRSEHHLTQHHLTPAEVGKLARAAGVKKVVVTHIAGATPNPADPARYREEIGKYFSGPVVIANDLDRF